MTTYAKVTPITAGAATVGPVGTKAARYAVENWHYSRTMPSAKQALLGVWEHGHFIGAVTFGYGASPNVPKSYGIRQDEIVELTRVALREHDTPVSQIVTAAVKLLRQSSPGLRLIISFADPHVGHHGGIYQAMNWVYTGQSATDAGWCIVHGRLVHSRTTGEWMRRARRLGYTDATRTDAARLFYDPAAKPYTRVGKYRYLLPLDKQMRRLVSKQAKPYPHAVEGSTVSRDTPGVEGQVRPLPTAPLEGVR